MIHIDDLNDPRLDAYRDIADKPLALQGGRFITEGKRVTERLLESDLGVDSVLTDDKRAEEMAAIIGDRCPQYVIPSSLMRQVAGYKIHTGVLGIGYRPAPLTLDDLLDRSPKPWFLIAAPIIKEGANLGALIRTAAAFGATGLLLGELCADPFYRRTVRVSMATVFRMPCVLSDDFVNDLQRLRTEFDCEVIATVLDEQAEQLYGAALNPDKSGAAIVLGHEVVGLDGESVEACDRKMTLPMQLGTDSLNVAVAAAVFAYQLRPQSGVIRLPEALDGTWI